MKKMRRKGDIFRASGKYPLIHTLEILTECSYRYLQVVIASEPSLGSRLDKPRSAS